MFVYLCVSVCLTVSISPELLVQSSLNLADEWQMLSMAMDRSSSGGVAIRFGSRDDVMFAHDEPYGGMCVPLQRVTSLRRRVQTNVPSASY